MYALIDPNVAAQYISSWIEPTPPRTEYNIPVYTQIGLRVADVVETQFEIAQPYFWVACADNVVADKFYFDESTQSIIQLPDNVERPLALGGLISEGVQVV